MEVGEVVWQQPESKKQRKLATWAWVPKETLPQQLKIQAFSSVSEQFYLLQVSSASSEPSGHSGSPSHRQRPGTHWPFKQANSAGAHVFLAGQRNRDKEKGCERLRVFSSSRTGCLQSIFPTMTSPANILKRFIMMWMQATRAPGLRAVCDITSPATTRLFWTWHIFRVGRPYFQTSIYFLLFKLFKKAVIPVQHQLSLERRSMDSLSWWRWQLSRGLKLELSLIIWLDAQKMQLIGFKG